MFSTFFVALATFLFVLLPVVQSSSLAQEPALPPSPPPITSGSATEAQRHLERGMALYKEQKLNDALGEVRKALQFDPGNKEAQTLLLLVNSALRSTTRTLGVPITNDSEIGTQESLAYSAVVLRKGVPIVFVLSADVRSDVNEKPGPTLQVVQDVRVDEFVVVPRGSRVKFALDKQDAGDMTEPGMVLLDIESVPSILGTEVVLSGVKAAAGIKEDPWEGCVEGWSCLGGIVFVHMMKGHKGKLQKDSLMTAYVSNDFIFDRPTLTKANDALAARRCARGGATLATARLHFYYKVPTQGQDHASGLAIRIDGNKLGRLKAWHYACTDVQPGIHELQVGKQRMEITSELHKEYFVRILNSANEILVSLTDGYEIEARPLLPAKFKKGFATECWNAE